MFTDIEIRALFEEKQDITTQILDSSFKLQKVKYETVSFTVWEINLTSGYLF
jgi:hypothetical protein